MCVHRCPMTLPNANCHAVSLAYPIRPLLYIEIRFATYRYSYSFPVSPSFERPGDRFSISDRSGPVIPFFQGLNSRKPSARDPS